MDKDKNKKTWTVNNLEIRSIQGDDGQPEKPVISGYAAVYNSESDLLYGFFREVIRPGAFDGSLGNDVRALWNHNASYVLGRTTAGTLDIRSDAKGLYFEVTPPNATWASDLVESIRRKDINQMSFGFMVNEDNWETLEDGTEMRELLDVDLQEVSVVTFPAYQATSAGVRSIDEAEEEIKQRYEQRNKKDEPTGPDERYYDYLRVIRAIDSNKDDDSDNPENDDSDDSDDEDQRSSKAVDDADGGDPLDPGSESDDPNDNDTSDDDEGDEDRSIPDADLDEDDMVCCDDCGTVQNDVCDTCGCCNNCCIC